ncbi:MAG TPA: TonB-dependent receptor [Polyangiaceae bacterium]
MKRLRRATLAVMALPLCARGARADTAELRGLLSESVVTTASAAPDSASSAPATSVTISAEELRRYGIRSLDEAIDFLALGVVTSDPLRTPDIGARGVMLPNDNGKHFLLLVNGHAINDPLFGAARFDTGAGVPVEIIDHIEVIVGPGSVLYGSNAMLGVINVITKRASDFSGGHVMGEYEPGGSFRAGAGAGFTFSLAGTPGEFTSYVAHASRFGPDLDFELQPLARTPTTNEPIDYGPNSRTLGHWGGQLDHAYFSEATSALLRLRLSDVEVNFLASTYEQGIPYSNNAVVVDFDDPHSDERDRALRIDVKHGVQLTPLVALTSRLYADGFDYRRRVNRRADLMCLENSFDTCQFYQASVAHWVGAELRLGLNWLEDSSLQTQIGFDARLRRVRSKEDALDADTGQPFDRTRGIIDDEGPLLSPYLEQTWNPTRWLAMSGGARLDVDPRFSPIVSPRLAVSVKPFEKTTVKGVYSQGFRAPAWAETETVERKQMPSAELAPEFVRSVEGSIEQRFGANRVMFGVFRSWWDDLVEQHILSQGEIDAARSAGEWSLAQGGAVRYQNISELTNYGYNASLRGSLSEGQLSYGLNGTAAYTRSRHGSEKRVLPVAPQVFGNGFAAYTFSEQLPTPALAVQYVGERLIDRAYEVEWRDPRYVSGFVRVRATLSGAVPGVPGLDYRLSATYSTASEGPYVVGLRPYSRNTGPQPVYGNPTDTVSAFFGLSYHFLGDERRNEVVP